MLVRQKTRSLGAYLMRGATSVTGQLSARVEGQCASVVAIDMAAQMEIVVLAMFADLGYDKNEVCGHPRLQERKSMTSSSLMGR